MRDALRSRRPWRASACRMLRNLTLFNLTASFDWRCCICYVYCVCCRCCCRSCGTECQRRIRRRQSDLAEPSLQHRPGSEQGRRFLQLLVRWRCWQSYPAPSPPLALPVVLLLSLTLRPTECYCSLLLLTLLVLLLLQGPSSVHHNPAQRHRLDHSRVEQHQQQFLPGQLQPFARNR